MTTLSRGDAGKKLVGGVEPHDRDIGYCRLLVNLKTGKLGQWFYYDYYPDQFSIYHCTLKELIKAYQILKDPLRLSSYELTEFLREKLREEDRLKKIVSVETAVEKVSEDEKSPPVVKETKKVSVVKEVGTEKEVVVKKAGVEKKAHAKEAHTEKKYSAKAKVKEAFSVPTFNPFAALKR